MKPTIVLYELAAADETRFSPFCWRTRWGLRHKGLDFESCRIAFPDIKKLGGAHGTVPAITGDGEFVDDSWEIARHLDRRFPEAPSLLGGPMGEGMAKFVECFTDKVIHPTVLRLLSRDVFDRMRPEDQGYFRLTREEMLGATLEDAQATRDDTVKHFRKAIHPLRLTIKQQPWLCGAAPGHGDYIVLAAFQWARLASDYPVLMPDDPMHAWVQRGLDLFDGFGRRVGPSTPGLSFDGQRVAP